MAGRCFGHRSTRTAAMHLVDKPYRFGTPIVRDLKTGEQWERRSGSWFKTREHWPDGGAR
jgi:hypothetical protein